MAKKLHPMVLIGIIVGVLLYVNSVTTTDEPRESDTFFVSYSDYMSSCRDTGGQFIALDGESDKDMCVCSDTTYYYGKSKYTDFNGCWS